MENSTPKRKQPSGQQKRIARREKAAELRERQAERVASGNGAPTFQPIACEDITRVHLHQLRRLLEAQELLLKDETVSIEERAKLIVTVAHAMAKINTQAQLEAEMDEYKREIQKRDDELVAAQAAALSEKQKWQQARAALAKEPPQKPN